MYIFIVVSVCILKLFKEWVVQTVCCYSVGIMHGQKSSQGCVTQIPWYDMRFQRVEVL